MKSLTLVGFLLIWLLLSVGCDRAQKKFNHVDVTGIPGFGNTFSLPDGHGQQRKLADFRGKVVLLFFGYTHCPDVCPTTLARLREVMVRLGPDADKLVVLFVTLDPARDSAVLLREYVPSFDPRFIGLRPDDELALQKITRDFKIYYHKVPAERADRYTIDHTSGSYVFDMQGRLRLFVRDDENTTPLVEDLRLLISAS